MVSTTTDVLARFLSIITVTSFLTPVSPTPRAESLRRAADCDSLQRFGLLSEGKQSVFDFPRAPKWRQIPPRILTKGDEIDRNRSESHRFHNRVETKCFGRREHAVY